MVSFSDQTHIDPADYFRPDVEIPAPSLITKYIVPVGLPACLLLTVCGSNYFARKPAFTGIHKHVLAVVGGVLGGLWIENLVRKNTAKRDAIIYDYIRTHPEDFPPVERVKFKDVLEKWGPNRFW